MKEKEKERLETIDDILDYIEESDEDVIVNVKIN